MLKHGVPTHALGSRLLLSGLAGGTLVLSPPLRADNSPVAVVSPLAAAVQAAWTEAKPRSDDGGGLPLRLSQMIARPANKRKPPQWMGVVDAEPSLKVARELQPVVGVGGGATAATAATAGGGGAASGAAIGGSAEETVAGLAVGRPSGLLETAAAGAPAAESRGIAGTGWEIPPIRWGGSLGYNYQHSSSDPGATSVSQGLSANLNASSYIYAPWLARVSGRLGMNRNTTTQTSSGDNGQSDSISSSNLVGGGEVNMFSSSRYPFRVYYDRSDSRGSGTIVTTDYVSDRYGLSQGFRSEEGSNGNFMLDRSSIKRSDGRTDDVTAASGSYSMATGIVQNNFSARYSLGEQSGTGNRASLMGFNSSHNASLSDTLSLGALMNYSDTDIRTATGFGGSSLTRGRFLQLYTYGTWLPEFEDLDDLPLTLTGGLRYASQETGSDATNSSIQTVAANLSALYRYSRNLTFYGNGAQTMITQAQGGAQMLTLLGTGLNYSGDPLVFGKYSYNWNAGAGANWQSGVGTAPANTVETGNVSHMLSRSIDLAPGHGLMLSGSQTLSEISNQQVGNSQTLTNTLAANLSFIGGERFSGSLTSMLSDVQTTGYSEQHYRTLNVGLNGQGQLSQVSSANFNLLFNWADQSYKTVDATGGQVTQGSQHMTINGVAAYSHQRFAGFRGLRYNVIFVADSRLRDERLYGDVNGNVDRSRYSLTNRLEYRIGLLDFRLSLTNSEAGGKKNALLFFQVVRQIGSY